MAPPVVPGSLVLVSGVNGHVASCIVLRLLEKGYKVRGTVRSLASAAFIKQQFASYGAAFEVVEVSSDISKPGVFKDALVGVDAVIHTASPVTMDATKPEQQYVPSIQGTLSILRSAHETPSVKRVLYLGSMGSAVMTAKDPTKEIITRDDWNVMTPELVKNLDDPMIGFHIYVGSKLEGEKAAWAYIAEEKPAYSLTTLLGSIIFGPIPKALPSAPRQDQSLGQVYDCFADPPRVPGVTPIESIIWVHAFDVADLFVASLSSTKSENKRLLAVAGRLSWVQVTDIVRKKYPNRPFPPSKDDAPHMNYPGSTVIKFDTALEEELLGGGWRSLEDTVISCADDLIAREAKGWDKA